MFWIYVLIVIGLLSGLYLLYRALKSDTDEEAVSFGFLSGGILGFSILGIIGMILS
jgi:hypothetical protein